jgi:hypothetical protein
LSLTLHEWWFETSRLCTTAEKIALEENLFRWNEELRCVHITGTEAGDCEDFEALRSVCQTTVVNTERVVGHLATGLNLNRHQIECLVPNLAWRMGLVEERRGKQVTWYFACHLNRDTTAQKLLIHLSGHRADRSARILTSSPVPLPASSPLAQYEVVHLADLMRVSQNRFECFANRVMEPAAVYEVHDSTTDPGSSNTVCRAAMRSRLSF